jgi:post-segregation antitoxin (ccd killing protein)
VLASYIDNLGSSENVASAGVTVAAQNAIVIENQKTGTTAWQISNLASNNEIAGYGDATSINKGQALNLKISLAQAGQYRLDVYRLGYYGGTGGRLVTSVTGLNGVVQAGPTTDPSTRLVEYKWNTSYTLQTGTDWTTGLYLAKLTDSRTGKQTYVQFVLRDDNRPADIGFQDSVSTTEAYNNYGGYSTYDANSSGGQRAYQVSFDRPLAAANLGLTNTDGFNTNNMLAWEYNMVRWQESQGYDVSYFTNIDTSINPLQLYSQNVFQVTGHDEYWSMEMMNNVTNARDKGINLAFFSANTAYWRVRFEPSSNGQANRVMTVYKDTSGIGTSGDPLDPIAQTDPSAATTLFRSPQVNRPENALMGVGYIGDTGNPYGGYDFVVSNASDPYYANTGLKNGDKLTGLVGYEWDGLLPNGFAPTGLVVLSQSPVPSSGLGSLGLLPPGTNDTISNAVRYTAASGAKVFSTGSVQWVWGLDSDGVTNPRVDIRVQQIAVNVLKDMGAKPKTPSTGIVV